MRYFSLLSFHRIDGRPNYTIRRSPISDRDSTHRSNEIGCMFLFFPLTAVLCIAGNIVVHVLTCQVWFESILSAIRCAPGGDGITNLFRDRFSRARNDSVYRIHVPGCSWTMKPAWHSWFQPWRCYCTIAYSLHTCISLRTDRWQCEREKLNLSVSLPRMVAA